MRALLACLLLTVVVVPAAEARRPLPTGEPFYDADLIVSPDDCQDCYAVDAVAGLAEPEGCADCGGIGAHLGARGDSDSVTVSAQVCRGGFVVICVVDHEREFVLP